MRALTAPPEHETLTADEARALTAAATWYFQRHARMIANEADEDGALAVSRRDDFRRLHSALGKLGVQVALPDELRSSLA